MSFSLRAVSRMTALTCVFACFLAVSLPSFAQEDESAERFEAGPAARQQWFYGQRAYPFTHTPPGVHAHAFAQKTQMLQRESAARLNGTFSSLATLTLGTWKQIGPQPSDQSGYGYGKSSGRITAIAVDPTTSGANTVIYIGGAEGGIWKSSNNGSTWTPLTDSQASLAIGSIAIDPNNHNIIYAGTGEENFSGDSYYGQGILKSTNGGTNWTLLGSSKFGGASSTGIGGAYIGAIAVQPGASSTPVLLAATEFSNSSSSDAGGIWRSTDGGTTWAQVFPTGGNLNENFYSMGTSVFFVSSTKAYCAISKIYNVNISPDVPEGVYVSNDAGATWNPANGTSGTTIPGSTTTAGRITLVGAPSTFGTANITLYAAVADRSTSGLYGMYKSTNGGSSWSALATPFGTSSGSTGDFCGGQCWYDMPLAVHPTSAGTLYAGGSFNYGAQNGGIYVTTTALNTTATWATPNPGTNNVKLHPDFHAFAFSGDGNTLYIGEDGGIWSGSPANSQTMAFTDLNNSLAITEFYPGLAIFKGNKNIALNGTQDNGTQLYSGALQWTVVTCGDGAWAAIDPGNSSNMYTGCTSANQGPWRSTNGGTIWSLIKTGIVTAEPIEFIPPMIMDPNNATVLYYATNHLYKMTDATGASPSWAYVNANQVVSQGDITSMAITPGNSNNIFVGGNKGEVHYSTTAGTSFTQITSGLPTRHVTMVQADPKVGTTFYVTYSGFSGFGGDSLGHVFKCSTSTNACTDISGNLPNTPANDIVIDPDLASTYYLATDIGVFYTTNGGTTWATAGTGLPNVAVAGLKLHEASRTLRATTHGRSTWDLSVPATATGPDLIETAVSNPPASAVDGGGFSVTDTAKNQGNASAGASTTRFWLSTTTSKSGGKLLTGTRSVPSLAATATSAGAGLTVHVPLGTAANTYFLLACADDLNVVTETKENNNCKASTSQVTVPAFADLIETAVSNPPSTAVLGTTFTVSDTAKNQGNTSAAASSTRFYLSTTTSKSGGVAMVGTRSVPSLAAGATSAGSGFTVKVAAGTSAGAHYLLACADDLKVVTESNEGNNCKVAATQVTISGPDLIETTVTNPPTTINTSASFSVTDTVKNNGTTTSQASHTRYYLSTTTAWSASSILLTGSRAVGSLAAAATSNGTVSVTVPGTLANGTYFLLACADDTKTVPETNEKNNCKASASTGTH